MKVQKTVGKFGFFEIKKGRFYDLVTPSKLGRHYVAFGLLSLSDRNFYQPDQLVRIKRKSCSQARKTKIGRPGIAAVGILIMWKAVHGEGPNGCLYRVDESRTLLIIPKKPRIRYLCNFGNLKSVRKIADCFNMCLLKK